MVIRTIINNVNNNPIFTENICISVFNVNNNSKNNYHHTLNHCLSIDDNNKYICKKSCDDSAHKYNDNSDN